jgi:hypothetical protein
MHFEFIGFQVEYSLVFCIFQIYSSWPDYSKAHVTHGNPITVEKSGDLSRWPHHKGTSPLLPYGSSFGGFY